MLKLQLMLDARLGSSKILLIWLQVALVGVLEGSRQGGHDLSAVTEIAANLSPLLRPANLFKATSGFHSLFQLVEIQRTLINAR